MPQEILVEHNVTATRNILYDVIQPVIGAIQPPDNINLSNNENNWW